MTRPIISSEKNEGPPHVFRKKSSLPLLLQRKNEAPRYFFRKKRSVSLFLQKKIERLIISSEKNHFFLKKY
jgi:hypothetical protein